MGGDLGSVQGSPPDGGGAAGDVAPVRDHPGQTDARLQGETEQHHVGLLQLLIAGLAELPDEEPQPGVGHVVKLLMSGGLRDRVKL